MDIRDAFALTGASIRTHKLRSVLAAIGVVLGIGSVIGVVTMGAGFQQAILGSFTDQFSADLLAVSIESKGANANNGPPVSAPVSAFTDRDLAQIAKIADVKEVGATTPIAQASVSAGVAPLPGIAVSARSGPFQFSPLDQGRAAVTSSEATISNQTALHVMETLNRSDVIGTSLTVTWPNPSGGFQNATVIIVGIDKPSQFFTQETMTVGPTFAPQDAGGATHGWQSFAVRATSSAKLADVKTSVKSYLDSASDAKTRKGERLDFRYDTQADVIKLINTAVAQFTAFIGALGAVALLVGLVGIANIMLVSVQERTREIGVMKATGATRGEILLVFLVESVAICIVGAILGIGLGMLMGLGLDAAIASFSGGNQTVPFVLVPQWYAIAVVLGVVVGLVAGLYPAWRAAKVSPVEALRYE